MCSMKQQSKLSLHAVALSALCVLAGCSSKPRQGQSDVAQAVTPQCVIGKPNRLVNLELLARADAAEAWAQGAHEAGLGFAVRETDSGFVVTDPSQRALDQGVQDGDVVVCIAANEGERFFDSKQFELDEVVTLLRGSPGSKAGVRLQRAGVPQELWLVRSR
jgi:C-terminal processing protease CtpA/Prc